MGGRELNRMGRDSSHPDHVFRGINRVLTVGAEVLATGAVGTDSDSNLSLEKWSMSITEKSSLKCRRFMLITTRSGVAPAAMASLATCRKEDWVIRV